MSVIIGAIRIYTTANYDTRSDIGLYSVEGENAQLRWSEKPLVGVADTWASDILLFNGIGVLDEKFDDSYGGNPTMIGDHSFSLKGSNQIILRLMSLGIILAGLTYEYIEFVGTDEDSDADSIDVLFTGTIEDISYNQFESVVTGKSSFLYKRNNFIGTFIIEETYPDVSESIKGNVAPMMFGRSDPSEGRFFKAVQIQEKNDLLSTPDFMQTGFEPDYLSIFPAIALRWEEVEFDPDHPFDPISDRIIDLTAIEVAFMIGSAGYAGYLEHLAYELAGKYVKVVEAIEGFTENIGQFRKISTKVSDALISVNNGSFGQQGFWVYLAEYFFRKVNPNYADISSNAVNWINIYDMFYTYAFDIAPCEKFISDKEFYTEEGIRILGIGVNELSGEVPYFEVSPSAYDGEPGTLSSKVFIEIDEVEQYYCPTNKLNYIMDSDGDFSYGDYIKAQDGIYVQKTAGTVCSSSGVITGTEEFKDRDYETQWLFEAHLTLEHPVDHFDYATAFKLSLPEIDESISFDKVYLGVRIVTAIQDDSASPKQTYEGKMFICRKSYYDRITRVVEQVINNRQIEGVDEELWHATLVTVESLPDSYYSNSPDDDNKEFNYMQELAGTITGFKNFDLQINNLEEYKNINDLVILFFHHSETLGINTYVDDATGIFEAAVIFEKSVSILGGVFA